jgi:16S rRNA (cytosine967-C5)-methyltransferase
MIVADLCAAPGGKALAMSERAARMIAADRSESRMRMVKENALRTGWSLDLVVADAVRSPLQPVDAVLLDVPCTGTGTLARHPDARWRLQPDNIDEMAAVQARMLDAAADLVRPGGLLIYSTCTLEPEENEDRVTDFLASHKEFVLEPTGTVDSMVGDEGFVDASGYLRVEPWRSGYDGSFAARLRKLA